MVYDCIPFFNEIDILKLRLNILSPCVDRFVIEEATVTFSGAPKELCFEKNRDQFAEFLPKIDYIVVDDSPVRADTHTRDKYQKNKLIKGLEGLTDQDIIILSDVDEIPNPERIREIAASFDPDKVYHLAQRMFYCYLNMEEVSGNLLSITGEFAGVEPRQWLGTKIFSPRRIPAAGIIDIREADITGPDSVRVADGGWHFGYMGGQGEKDASKRIGVKVKAAAHQEYSSQDILAEATDRLVLGRDIFGRQAEFVRVEIDESFPDYLRDHKEEYEHLIMPPIGKGKALYTQTAMTLKRFARKALRRSEKLLTMSKIALMTLAGLFISLLPELYLTLVNRAAGDDYGYGYLSRNAWQAGHSLIEVIKAAGTMVGIMYDSWQGTWFSIFLFALQPEVFHEKAYFLVTIAAIGLWVGITAGVLYFFLVTAAGFRKSGYGAVTGVFLILNMQFIPGIKSSMFWYNGIIHYLLPYLMCLLTVYLLAGFVKKPGWKHLGGITVLLGLLGGSNYQSALFALLITFIFMAVGYWRQRKIKYFLLLLPLSIEMAGLMISMLAPGNRVRGGEDFGFSMSRAGVTIYRSVVSGIGEIGSLVFQKPVAAIGLLMLLVLIITACKEGEGPGEGGSRESRPGRSYPYPGLFVTVTFGLYCAMQAPEIYADTDVSLGVANINYQTLLLMILADGVYVGGWLKRRGKLQSGPVSHLLVPALVLCFLLTGLCRGNIRETTAWKSLTYITSGQSGDYKEQMELQTAILLDPEMKDAVLPFINDDQGPLMHMPATENPEAWTNSVMKDFYGKNSVIAMDRTEWNKLYGYKYGNRGEGAR